MVRTKLAIVVGIALMVAVGCGGKGVVIADDVTRMIMQNGKRTTGVLDQAAVEAQVGRNLGRLETVNANEQGELLSQACTAKDLYELREAKSLEDAVGKVVGLSPSAGARRDAVLDLADDLIEWNRAPTVAGGMSISGDAICLFN